MSQNTNWGYIVKNNLLNEVTVPRESDGLELAVSKMKVETDVDNPILMSKDKATTYIDDKLKASVADSHKAIAGEYTVADAAEAQAFLTDYAAGKDHTLNNGRVFNNGNASPGEVIYLVPATGSTLKTEEILVGAAKELITLSNENVIDSKLTDFETRITDNESALTNVDTSAEVDGKVAVEKTERENDVQTINTAADALELRVKANETEIVDINAKDLTQDGRLEALETAESLSDKVWTGTIALTADTDISAITDTAGETFDFTAGKKLEVVIEKTSVAFEQGHNLTVGAANATPYVIGTRNVQAKLTATGHLLITGNDLSDLNVIEVREAAVARAVTVSYSKNESDAKYATIANLALANTAIAGKQDKVDSALQTTTKSVVGAINELDGKIKINDPLVAQLGSIKTSDGDDLSTTTGIVMTEDKLGEYYTKTEVDAAIIAALSEVMGVKFTDGSSGTFKLGK